jgi:hypothetical protein
VDLLALKKVVSPKLAAVVRRAMAPSKNDRFATAGELANALTEAAREGNRAYWHRSGRMIASAASAVIARAACALGLR